MPDSCSDLVELRLELELHSEMIREVNAKLKSMKLEHRRKLRQLRKNEEAQSKKKNKEEKKEDDDDDDSCDITDDDDDEDSCDVTDDDDDDDDDDDIHNDAGHNSAMLLFGASAKWKPMFKILEADPTEIGLKTRERNTILHVAAHFDNLTVFKRLVRISLKTQPKRGKRMLSITDKNLFGDTPLHLAAQIGNPNVAAYLTSKNPLLIYELNHQGCSPLYFAVKHRHLGIVEDMFTALPPSDVPKEMLDKVVRSPKVSLAHAAIQTHGLGRIEMLSLLLIHLPSTLETPNVEGLKPLSYVSYEGFVEEVEFILKNFPHCAEEPDEDGSYPIHIAIVGFEIDVVEKFLSLCPATVSLRDKKQRTILHVAASNGKTEVLEYLSNKHSDKIEKLLDSRDVDGKTFKDLAKARDLETSSLG